MDLEMKNAQRAGQDSKGANAVQCDVADVSVSHIFPGVFEPTALALMLMAFPKRGVTIDEDAVVTLCEMGWPMRVQGVELLDGRPITWWSLDWDGIDDGCFGDWVDRFVEGLDEIEAKATGRDRLALERLDWFLEAEENRTSASRLALPSSAEYAAIAERVIQGAFA